MPSALKQAEGPPLTGRPFRTVPAVGLEPTRPFEQSILSAPRLPFRHAGLRVASTTLAQD